MVKIGANLSGGGRCEFTVWAPFASAVDLVIVSTGEVSISMSRSNDGYWSIKLDNINPGTRYFYLLDGKIRLPDPSSTFQPEGVHGPSEVIDHSLFRWHDQSWRPPPLERMIIYELHTGTFTDKGTFEAIIPEIPYLKTIGITAIELMPVAQFPGSRNWGYDGVYPYAVQNSYGGPDGLKMLCDACHANGFSLFLDVVYNHIGPEGNYLLAYGPYFTDKYKSPWGDAINFDGEYSGGVRNFFIMNALHWFENYHIDGLRLDAVHGIYDTGARHILEELADTVKLYCEMKGRKHYLIAESDLNDNRIVRDRKSGGYSIDAQWCDDFHHSVHTLLTKECKGYYADFGKPELLAKSYSEGYVYSGEYSKFRKRAHGNSGRDIPGGKMIVFIQNHDQVGNRMPGERITALAGFEAHKLAAGALFSAPYIPLLFMGEEYAETSPFLYFISHGDPGLVEAVRRGRKSEFASFGCTGEPPDPQSIETFEASRPHRGKVRMKEHRAMFGYYRELIRIRKSSPPLKNLIKQNTRTKITGDGRVIILTRSYRGKSVTAIMNFSSSAASLLFGNKEERFEKVIDSSDTVWGGPGSSAPCHIDYRLEMELRPFNFILYKSKRSE